MSLSMLALSVALATAVQVQPKADLVTRPMARSPLGRVQRLYGGPYVVADGAGRRIFVYGGKRGGTVFEPGKPPRFVDGGRFYRALFTPDGKHLATSTEEGVLTIYRLPGGAIARRLTVPRTISGGDLLAVRDDQVLYNQGCQLVAVAYGTSGEAAPTPVGAPFCHSESNALGFSQSVLGDRALFTNLPGGAGWYEGLPTYARSLLTDGTTGATEVLYEGPPSLRDPGLSPDGTLICGVRATDGVLACLTRRRGEAPQTIVLHDKGPVGRTVRFSPDGARLLYLQKPVGQPARLMVVDLSARTEQLVATASPDARAEFLGNDLIALKPLEADYRGVALIRPSSGERWEERGFEYLNGSAEPVPGPGRRFLLGRIKGGNTEHLLVEEAR